MNRTLMSAIVELAAFLALSGDDIVNPDAAVSQLEQLSAKLRELSAPDREAFISFVQELAEAERKRGDSSRAEFLAVVPENLGLR
jgi:hypothetical protein